MAEVVDPYVDPDTGLLRNLVGARTKDALERAEGDLSYARAGVLNDRSIRSTGDLDEFRAIHKQLFQDVYSWAGEVRTVDFGKSVEGAGHFLPVSAISRGSMFAADELRQDNMLRAMDREEFIAKLSHHYDQWNYIHPFREGNGRTQRVFWSGVAESAGWQLDWRMVSGEVNDAACQAASQRKDLAPLRIMFNSIVSPAVRDTAPNAETNRLALKDPATEAGR